MYMTHASPQTAREYMCGWGSAFINITTTFPLNKVQWTWNYLTTCSSNVKLNARVQQLMYLSLFMMLTGYVSAAVTRHSQFQSSSAALQRRAAKFVQRSFATTDAEDHLNGNYVWNLPSVQACKFRRTREAVCRGGRTASCTCDRCGRGGAPPPTQSPPPRTDSARSLPPEPTWPRSPLYQAGPSPSLLEKVLSNCQPNAAHQVISWCVVAW